MAPSVWILSNSTLPVLETRFKMSPLIKSVVERFPKGAFGEDSAVCLKMEEEFFEMVVIATYEELAGKSAKGREMTHQLAGS